MRRCSGLSTNITPPSDQNAWPPRLASGSWSSRITRRPASASSAVATRPASPAPTTITSASIHPFGAQDLGERGPADLELALVGLPRADDPLDLEAGAADGAGGARLAVALAPREHLDGGGRRGDRDRPAGQRPRPLDDLAQQHGAGDVGGEHRRDEVRAAAVVLLVGVRGVRR